jgi:hypothetical protein
METDVLAPPAKASPVINPQNRAVGDEDGQQTGRLRGACVFAHEMLAAGRLVEGFARMVDPRRSGGGILRSDAPETTKAMTLPEW